MNNNLPPLVYGSVASGIEAATMAWHQLGWKPAWFSEIEPFPCRLLEYYYPNVPNLGDMNLIHKTDEFKRTNINVLVGGTPCQSFSVAGIGKGILDPRGKLAIKFVEIAARKRPEWLVWENVPGVLSSNNGTDFATFLGALTGRKIHVPKEGFKSSGFIQGISSAYGVAWRVLDAQYFGVAQRRRRVFVVGHLGDYRRAAAVLFERESMSGYYNEGEAKRKGASAEATRSVGKGGTWWNGEEVAGTLTKHNASGVQRMPDKENFGAVLVPEPPIVIDRASMNCGKNASYSMVIEQTETSPTLIKKDGQHAVLQTFALAENLIGRQPENGGNGSGVTEDGPMYTLNTTGVPGVCIAFDTTQISSPTNRSNPQNGDPCHTLSKGQHPPLIVHGEHVETYESVRRLTPLECERLQGFPDNYTAIPGAKDTPRYAALGNTMAVPVMLWLGQRIDFVRSLYSQIKTS